MLDGSTFTLTTVNNDTYDPSGLPVISSTMTIGGNGSTITPDNGAPAFRLFAIAPGGNLTLQDTTVSGGVGVTFVGGGVYNAGTLTLSDSTLSGNSAGDGGGVFNYAGPLTLTNSTLSGNSSSNSGGGVANAYGLVTLARVLVAGNAASSAAKIVNDVSYGTMTANNFNLFGANGNAGVVGFTPGPTDIVPAAGVLLSDILALLTDNGGPTFTHALVPGSPAVDASPASANCPATDQRGVSRPQGPCCDIGAFEGEDLPPGMCPSEVCNNCMDDDDDGLIDLLDPDCAATALTAEKGMLIFSPTFKKDQINLQATFPATGVTLNPPAEGVTLSLVEEGDLLACVQIPPGAGWTTKGLKWSFKDNKDGSLGDPTLDTLSVQCSEKKATCTVKATIKKAEVMGAMPGDITTMVVIGDDNFLKTQPWKAKAKGNKLVTP